MIRPVLTVLLTMSVVAAPLVAEAQQPVKVPRIGYPTLGFPADPTFPRLREAFLQGMREHGHVEGQTIAIEWRFAEGRGERLPDLAAELVRLKVDVILAGGFPAVRAAKSATTTIPIVMAAAANPVDTGLVASLARPGGNVTGLANLTAEVTLKGMELFREVLPEVTRVAVLWNPANPGAAFTWGRIQVGARALGLHVQPLEVRAPNDLEPAFDEATRARADALVTVMDSFTLQHWVRLAEPAARSRLPAMYAWRGFVEAGGLLSYGENLEDMFRRAATFVDKILKGAKPADLPVEQATKFELVINLKAAKALGVTIPQSVLIRADEIIR